MNTRKILKRKTFPRLNWYPDPFDQGYRHAIVYWGHANPYRPGTQAWTSYRAGWLDATQRINRRIRDDPKAVEERVTKAATAHHDPNTGGPLT